MDGLIRRARVRSGRVRLKLNVAERSYRPLATNTRLSARTADSLPDQSLLLFNRKPGDGPQGVCTHDPPIYGVAQI